jgi:hypothetical protein
MPQSSSGDGDLLRKMIAAMNQADGELRAMAEKIDQASRSK